MIIKLAGCIITGRAGKILLLHRNTDKYQHWEIPGGKIESGETAERAAIRELKEELGIEVKILKKIGSKEFVDAALNIHYTWFEAKILSGKTAIAEPQFFDDIGYFSITELSNMTQSLGLQNYLALKEVTK